MCPHNWRKINDVFVCLRCGLTRTVDGKILFDRKIVNFRPKRRKISAKNSKTTIS